VNYVAVTNWEANLEINRYSEGSTAQSSLMDKLEQERHTPCLVI